MGKKDLIMCNNYFFFKFFLSVVCEMVVSGVESGLVPASRQ